MSPRTAASSFAARSSAPSSRSRPLVRRRIPHEFRSVHSTWGNLAYTQLNCLPLIQIASITGIWSISFLVFLFSSTIAVLFAPATLSKPQGFVLNQRCSPPPSSSSSSDTASIASPPPQPFRASPSPSSPPTRDFLRKGPAAVTLVRAYVDQDSHARSSGRKGIVLPEKIARIQGDDLAQADAILEQAARDNHVTILVSFEHQPNLHEARLYSPDGSLEGTYEKHHMLPAFESHLLPGTARLTFDRPSDDGTAGKWGVEICKDMDFPLLARQYSNDGARLMLVPAWDFVVDGWLHSRMAILRGVENGFSIARVAKQGISPLPTIADVFSPSGTAFPRFATLIGSVPVRNEPTIYARTGNWFAWVNLVFAGLLFLPSGARRPTPVFPFQNEHAPIIVPTLLPTRKIAPCLSSYAGGPMSGFTCN